MLESEVKKTETYMEQNESPVDNILRLTKSVGLQGLGGAEKMRQKLEEYEAIKNVIIEYVNNNFHPEIDFGQTDSRSEKKTLKKPGAEKLCRMFNTHPTWLRDTDSWESSGKPAGTIFLICRIIDNETGQIIGEGRGAAKIGETGRDANKTVKIAEKRAIVDAALYTFMLSEFFTQDEGARNSAFTLSEWKKDLVSTVGTLRIGVESNLSDLNWIVKVCEHMLHQKQITTLGQCQAVRKAVVEERKFDLSTGEKVGE